MWRLVLFVDNLVVVIGILKECRRCPFSRRALEAFSQGCGGCGGFVRRPFPHVEREIIVRRTEPSRKRLAIRWSGGGSSQSNARPRALDSGGQATKGAWGMSRHQEALKGAEDCDKPGVTVKQVMIPGFPNRLQLNP